MKKLQRKAILWFMQTRCYAWLLLHIFPYIRFTLYYSKFPGEVFDEGRQVFNRCHFGASVDHKKLTTKAVPGVLTHAFMKIANKGKFQIAEMTHCHFTASTFFKICAEADRVVLCRCTDWDKDYFKKVRKHCLTFRNTPYDVAFELGVKALYCSELVYQADFERRLKVDLSDIACIGREYLSPDGLVDGDNVIIIWDSDKAKDKWVNA